MEAFEAFFVALLAVGLAEVGDKTQGLSAVLGARYRKPVTLFLALAAATLINNALAGALSVPLRLLVRADALPWTLCIGLIGLAAWSLNAERSKEKTDAPAAASAFPAAFKAFFMNGICGKAQVAACMLTLNSEAPILSVAGATLGVLLACLPALSADERLAGRVSANVAHWGAALIYAVLAYIAVNKGGVALWFLTGKHAS